MRKLARAVKVTLGPTGRNVVLEKSFGSPTVTKDGVTVAKEIELEDAYENMGAQMVKEVASKTSHASPATAPPPRPIYAEAIFDEGLKNVAAGANAMQIKRGIDKAVEAVVDELKKMCKPVESSKEIAQVGTCAANQDAADRQDDRRGDGQGRQGRRHHRRRRQEPRDRRRAGRRHAVRQGLPLARTSSTTPRRWKSSSRTPTS